MDLNDFWYIEECEEILFSHSKENLFYFNDWSISTGSHIKSFNYLNNQSGIRLYSGVNFAVFRTNDNHFFGFGNNQKFGLFPFVS